MADFNNIKPQTLLHQPKKAFQLALVLKNHLQIRHKRWDFDSWVRKIPWRRAWQGFFFFFNFFINQLYFLEQV